MSQYRTLAAATLDSGVNLQRPHQTLPAKVQADSPAIDVMTDLSRTAAVTVSPHASAEEAEQKMISHGVRLLFVTNHFGHVTGIVTSRDVAGEKIVALVSAGTPREELTVHDVMTHQHQVDVLEMGDVARATVGDVVATLKRMGRQHALVIDRDKHGQQEVRGIMSATQIGKTLGIRIDTTDIAGSFARLVGFG